MEVVVRMISEHEASNLVNQLTTAVVLLNGELNLVFANAAAETLFETSAAKLTGLSLERFFFSGEKFVEAVRQSLAESRTFTERDVLLLRPHLGTLKVDCTVSPWWPTRGEPMGLVLEIASVERHQRIQAEEAKLLQNHITTALMRGLAHEVKNPLGGIRGAAQLLERELGDPRHTEYTQIIIGEADRLRKLVDRMLGPRGELNRCLFNIHEVLEHVRQVVEIERDRRVVIERDYDPSLPEIYADRDLLIQAFLNLVRNAVQAMNGHGGTIVLRTRAQRKFTIGTTLHRLVIRADIIDDGPGVDPQIADSIFFPMVSGRAEGSGLGLPIAQSLVNRQGGLIGFNSEPGNTVFTVWLPIRNDI
jgi:two-component system nitrogen regulation sensor histidine kinase GlnL